MTNAQVTFYKGKIAGVLSVVFLAGMGAGAVGTTVYQRRTLAGQTASAPHADSHPASLAVEHLRDELSLDSEQYAQVRGVLDHCIMLEADMLTQIQLLRSDGRERIVKVLNSDQRAKFESLLHQVSSP